jgi:hypothetical protein
MATRDEAAALESLLFKIFPKLKTGLKFDESESVWLRYREQGSKYVSSEILSLSFETSEILSLSF